MKTRVYPTNPDCPLSDKEKLQLNEVLKSLEWEAYAPLKHLTSSYAEAKVTEYDEFEINVEIEFGSDTTGSHDTSDVIIKRSDFTVIY